MDRINFKPNQINDIPNISGVYLFYDDVSLLYVGKAKFLRNRIKEHYKNNPLILRAINNLVNILGSEIKRLDFVFGWIETIQTNQIIDFFCHNIKRIEVIYLPHPKTRETEKDMIALMKPKFNHQTLNSSEINSLFQLCNKIDNLIVKSFW